MINVKVPKYVHIVMFNLRSLTPEQLKRKQRVHILIYFFQYIFLPFNIVQYNLHLNVTQTNKFCLACQFVGKYTPTVYAHRNRNKELPQECQFSMVCRFSKLQVYEGCPKMTYQNCKFVHCNLLYYSFVP